METNMIIQKFNIQIIEKKYALFVRNTENSGKEHQHTCWVVGVLFVGLWPVVKTNGQPKKNL